MAKKTGIYNVEADIKLFKQGIVILTIKVNL